MACPDCGDLTLDALVPAITDEECENIKDDDGLILDDDINTCSDWNTEIAPRLQLILDSIKTGRIEIAANVDSKCNPGDGRPTHASILSQEIRMFGYLACRICAISKDEPIDTEVLPVYVPDAETPPDQTGVSRPFFPEDLRDGKWAVDRNNKLVAINTNWQTQWLSASKPGVIIYADADGKWNELLPGYPGDVLVINDDGVPEWINNTPMGVSEMILQPDIPNGTDIDIIDIENRLVEMDFHVFKNGYRLFKDHDYTVDTDADNEIKFTLVTPLTRTDDKIVVDYFVRSY